jgi:hypothetical protein
MIIRIRFSLTSGGYLKGEGVAINSTTALVVFPEPGTYTLQVLGYGWVKDKDFGYPADLGKETFSVTVVLGSEEDSKPFLTRPRCKASDFDSTFYGYWTDFPNHATGTLRPSNYTDVGQMYTPFHCRLHYYSEAEAFPLIANRILMFLGDSTHEELIEAMLTILGLGEEQVAANGYRSGKYASPSGKVKVNNFFRHRLMKVRLPQVNTTVYHRFTGHPNLGDSGKGFSAYHSTEMAEYWETHPKPDLVLFSTGMHDGVRKVHKLKSFQQGMAKLVPYMEQTFKARGTSLVWHTFNLSLGGIKRGPYLLHLLFDWCAVTPLRERGIPIINFNGPIISKEGELDDYSDNRHYAYGVSKGGHRGHLKLTIIDAMAQIFLQGIIDFE